MIHQQSTKFALQRFTALFTNGQDFNGFAFGQQLFCSNTCQFDNIRVKATAQTPFSCHDDEQLGLIRSGACQQFWSPFGRANGGGQTSHHRIETFRIGAASLRRILCAAQFGRGDHLHRLCDLTGRFDRRDPVF